MSEAEIVYQMSETFNRVWSMQQWWASISFGMIVLAHVASEKLNAFLVAIVITLYGAFTFFVFQMLGRNWQSVTGYIKDLQRISDSGQKLGDGTLAFMQPQNELVNLLIIVALYGTYIGCNAYLLYRYFAGRRSVKA